ncbi:MAG: rane protein [Pseudomonas sp.]|nr:rane protein [Pseudomonas sp.]
MRAMANFIMRGRMQATLVVVGCAALPLLFWLSAAAGCLVLLRRGVSDAAGILAWALLPALVWWYFGEPRTFMVLLGSLGLAALLRASESWVRVLLVSVALGLLYAVVLGAVFREPIEAIALELQKLLPQVLEGFYQQLSVDERARLGTLIAPVLNGLIAALLQIVSVLALILGRYWQALLYNPGGFGREFRSIRLPRGPALVLLVCMLLGPSFGPQMAMLTPLCSVPLVFAGLALIHGLVAAKRLTRFWLVGLYVTLLLFMQLIYPLLVLFAIVDSLIDFRGRLASKDADNANGEG